MFKAFILGVSCALLCPIAQLRAQTSKSGAAPAAPGWAIIGEIHASGSKRYGDAQIGAGSGFKPGDSVTREDIQAAADRLSQTGLFTRVNYQFAAKGDKINLTFELADAPVVPAYFDNFPWFTDDQLTAAIREAAPIFDGNAPTAGTMLDDMTAALEKLIESRGVMGAVEHSLVAQPTGDAMMMQFRVEGPQNTVASVDFSDDLAQVNEKLKDRKADLIGKPFSRYSIDLFENEQVRPLYLQTGHIRVRFDPPEVQVTGGAGSQSSAQLPLTIEVVPGPVFSVGGFNWSGQKVFDEKSLAGFVGVKPGEQADGMRLTAGWHRIEDEYARRGYLDAKVTPEPRYDEQSLSVNYQVNISEGAQYHMGALIVTGLSVDSEKRLRAAWQIPPGQFFDRLVYDYFLTKIEKPMIEIFGDIPVHYSQMGHWLRADTEKHTVDVLLDFQ